MPASDYNDNLERIDARSSRSDRAMALVGAVVLVINKGKFAIGGIFQQDFSRIAVCDVC